jgi:hypothetical protein
MTTYTETDHDGEFIISEANFHRSRDSVELASGQDLAAGTVLQLDGGSRYIAYVGDEFTNGVEDEACAILIPAKDTTTGGHALVAIIARDAEVNINLLTFPAAKQAQMIQDLKARGIIVRS